MQAIFQRIITFLLLIISTSALAQKPGLIFHHLSLNDGLSENTIRDIIEDKQGFMWFGSEDGLNKYDGYQFTIYRANPADPYSISGSDIKFFYIDSKNNFWILTRYGVNIYDPVNDIFYNHKNTKYPVLKTLTGDAEMIQEDRQGNIWIAAGESLYKISSLSTQPKRYNRVSENNDKLFISILPDTDNMIWVGTRDGLLQFDPFTEEFTDLRSQYGRGYQIKHIHKDENKNLWLSTTNGLKVISKEGQMEEYTHSPANHESLNGDNVIKVIPYKGNFLLAIDGGGLDYFNVKSKKFFHYIDENESQLSSNNITSLYKDSKNDLWAGTYLNGVNFSNETTNLFVLIKNNPNSERTVKKGIISRFLKDHHENFWIATDGGGLYRRDSDSHEFIHYKAGEKGFPNNSILSIMEDSTDGSIWLSSYSGGLIRYDYETDSFKVYLHNPADPHSISNDKIKDIVSYNGKLWISGFGTGISVLDKSTDKFRHYRYDKFYPPSIPSDWVQCFLVDKEGTLWLGTFKGLSRYDLATNTFKNYSFKNSKNSSDEVDFIMDIVEDSQGNLWLGTGNNGLVNFNRKDGSHVIYTTKDGLSNNVIKSIIEDKHANLWLSTNNGITRFNIKTKKGKAYTIKDGVPPCSFFNNSKYRDSRGRIYFGTNAGYMIIDPRLTVENKNVPPIVITEFKIFNQPIYPGSKESPLKAHISYTHEITLTHDQNSITFEFVALNYNNSRNNNYSYWLQGFEETWVQAGNQRSATYTNLNPGTYTFRVKGSNNDNVWNEEGASITIIITPPFWKTWWFNSVVVTTVLLILYFIYYWRVNRIRNKNILLEETVKQRTRELKEANEQLETFVYKASHDIKGPLRSVIGLTTIGQKDVKDEVALTYFDHILKSTKKLDTLLRDLLEVTKVKQATLQIEKINFKELVAEAMAHFENSVGYEKIKFSIDIKESADFYSDKKLVYSLIQNLIENPIKYADFSKPESLVSVQITSSEKGADLIFKDNGIGIPEEFQKRVFDMFFKVNDNSNGTGLGLYIVKSTVEKLNGSIQLESQKGVGSTFYVKL